LSIFRVFERIRGDYFIFRNFPDRLFTSSGFKRIIPGYPTNPLHFRPCLLFWYFHPRKMWGFDVHQILSNPFKYSSPKILYHEALFTSRLLEGMGEDYFVSRNFPDRLFTSLGFEGIIPGYPHKSPPL
jgi:hypothetical protein